MINEIIAGLVVTVVGAFILFLCPKLWDRFKVYFLSRSQIAKELQQIKYKNKELIEKLAEKDKNPQTKFKGMTMDDIHKPPKE